MCITLSLYILDIIPFSCLLKQIVINKIINKELVTRTVVITLCNPSLCNDRNIWPIIMIINAVEIHGNTTS